MIPRNIVKQALTISQNVAFILCPRLDARSEREHAILIGAVATYSIIILSYIAIQCFLRSILDSANNSGNFYENAGMNRPRVRFGKVPFDRLWVGGNIVCDWKKLETEDMEIIHVFNYFHIYI